MIKYGKTAFWGIWFSLISLGWSASSYNVQLISHIDAKMGYNAVTLAKQLAVTKKNRFSDKLVSGSAPPFLAAT